MKRIIAIVFLLVLAVIGCTNMQDSSKEEAIYVAEQLPDFKRLVLYYSVSSGEGFLLPPHDPFAYQTTDERLPTGNKKNSKGIFIHEIIYETKSNELKLIHLDDNRPPKIVATITLR